jgi:hypothetical protein
MSRRRASAYSSSLVRPARRDLASSASVGVRGLSDDFMVAVGLPSSCHRRDGPTHKPRLLDQLGRDPAGQRR